MGRLGAPQPAHFKFDEDSELAAAASDDADDRGELVLGLVESVILRRRDTPDLDVPAVQDAVADGVLRLVGCTPTEIALARALPVSLTA